MNRREDTWTQAQIAQIRACLERVLASPMFLQSEQQRRFLRYIVTETVAGKTERLKGYTIGVEVFKRDPDFDPAIDSIVRVEAGRLRSKLREYYAGEGRADPAHFDLPKGSYVPAITLRAAASPAPGRADLGMENLDAVASSSAQPATHARPSLAVLPFVNMSTDPEQRYFAEGITEDVITDLSKLSGLFVISRHTAFAYKGSDKPLAEIARTLGVRYVIEGSVRRESDRLRITAGLIDTGTDRSLWAERYDRHVTDIFAVQDDVTRSIVQALQVRLTGVEADRLGHEGTRSVEAHDAVLRGLERYWVYSAEACAEAQGYFLRAVELDPSYATAHAWLARTYVMQYSQSIISDFDKTMAPALAHAQRAVELDNLLSVAHSILGWTLLWYKDAEQAIAEGRRACALDPNNADANLFLAVTLAAANRAEEGLRYAETGMRLNPHPSTFYLFGLGFCYYVMADFERAITAFRRGIELNPMFSSNHALLMWAYAELGREAEMRAERDILARMGRQAPGNIFTDPALIARFEKVRALADLG